MLVINPGLQIPDAELEFHYARSGGPGGQNVNKVNSKAILHWDVTASPSLPEPIKSRFRALFRKRIDTDGRLVLASQRYRDQGRNVADCLEKLRDMIRAAATPPKPRRATRPTRASREQRLLHKRRTARIKAQRRPPTAEE